MESMNIYYRVFKDYCSAIQADKKVGYFRDALKKNSTENDFITAIRTYAIVEEDWVCEIEEKMFYVEKAIREDRQFIKQNGEVVPIEKVKRVSYHSVKHLSQHADMISEEPKEGEDLVPDSLYIVENLTDYAVYENRFLYMLLNYVKDFITIRLDKIIELGMTYKSDVQIKKKVVVNRRSFTFDTTMHEENKKDELSAQFGNCGHIVHRLEDQLGMIIALLNTPLMQEVSKVAMLKPPITQTNVLRMNNNFKNAYELYHYLASYDKLGYEIKEIKNKISPFNDKLMGQFAEIMLLNSFLTYEYGNKLTDKLQLEYEKEEELRKKEADELKKKHIKDLKARVERTGKGIEEYILAVEERNRELEGDRRKLNSAIEKNRQLTLKIETLNNEIANYKIEIQTLKQDIKAWTEKYERDMLAQKEEYEQKIADITLDFENQLAEQKEEYEQKIADITADFENQLAVQQEEYEQKIATIIADYEERLSTTIATWQKTYDDSVASYENKISQLVQEKESEKLSFELEKSKMISTNALCLEQVKQLEWRNNLTLGELTVLRQKLGLFTAFDDFTEKERFKELETEFEAFAILFNSAWKNTKIRIKREILGVYPRTKLKKLNKNVDLTGKMLKEEHKIVDEKAQQVEEQNQPIQDENVDTQDNNLQQDNLNLEDNISEVQNENIVEATEIQEQKDIVVEKQNKNVEPAKNNAKAENLVQVEQKVDKKSKPKIVVKKEKIDTETKKDLIEDKKEIKKSKAEKKQKEAKEKKSGLLKNLTTKISSKKTAKKKKGQEEDAKSDNKVKVFKSSKALSAIRPKTTDGSKQNFGTISPAKKKDSKQD